MRFLPLVLVAVALWTLLMVELDDAATTENPPADLVVTDRQPDPWATHAEPPLPSTTTTVAHRATVTQQRKRTTAPIAAPDVWLALADCESGDGDGQPPYRYDDTYRGVHHGALQWHPDTWRRARQLSGLPVAATAWEAPIEDEIAVAKAWLRATSPRQWPICGPKVGLTMEHAA